MSAGGQRGGWRGGWRGRRFTKKEPIKVWPAPPLGTELDCFALKDFSTTRALEEFRETAKISGCETIASFNWADEEEPRIIIPGKPRRWTPLKGIHVLPEDQGPFYRDKNSARHPHHPMEPAVLAVLDSDPAAGSKLDIFCCGSTMGNLLRFVKGAQDNSSLRPFETKAFRSKPSNATTVNGGAWKGGFFLKPFRMLVEKVGDTVFFVRRENDPRETMEGVIGFGHSFPDIYTIWDDEKDIKGSDNNQRVVRYEFGGLRLGVRCGCDGYLPVGIKDDEEEGGKGGKQTARAKQKPTHKNGAPTVDHWLEEIVNTSLPKAKIGAPGLSSVDSRIPKNWRTTHKTPKTASTIKVSHGGSLVAQSQLFDLKTRSDRKRGDDILGQEIQRMWISQIPNFVLAFHNQGQFREEDIEVRNVEGEVREWEEKNQETLRQLAAVVDRIVMFVLKREIAEGKGVGSRVEVCGELNEDGQPELKIRQPGEGAMGVLSEEVRRRWIEGCDSAESEDGEEEKRACLEDRDSSQHESHSDDLIERLSQDDWSFDEPDYTACSEDVCGYCGKCKH